MKYVSVTVQRMIQKNNVIRRLGALASSTTKTGRHDIAEILLKVALNTKNQMITYAISTYHH
jgi:hypothetical protein